MILQIILKSFYLPQHFHHYQFLLWNLYDLECKPQDSKQSGEEKKKKIENADSSSKMMRKSTKLT